MVRSDEIFYRVFKEAPTTYFELIGVPAETAAGYQYTAEELKHAGLRLDGLFVPTRPGAPVHFVEAFTYKTQHAYSNLLAKVFLWLDTHDPLQDWRACVIFASQGIEKGIEKGEQQALERVALRLLATGDSPAEIAKVTGLSVAHVKRLKRKNRD